MKIVLSKKLVLVYLGLALCIAALSLSFACASGAPSATALTPKTTASSSPAVTAKPPSAPTGAQQYGGTLKVIDLTHPRSNLGYPAGATARMHPFLSYPCVESLLRVDEKGLNIPWLATGWQWSTDKKSLTLTLRKGVKFHDGTDFNAAAVKFNLDLFLPPSTRTELQYVQSIDVVDDYTVRLNLKQYDDLLLTYLNPIPGLMVSPTAIKEHGEQWCQLHPVGTGPFKFVSYQTDVSLKYQKFDGYWQKGKPYLDAFNISFIDDPVTARLAFVGGEADVITSVSPKDAADLKKTGKYTITSAQNQLIGLATDSIHPNSPFKDVRVRQAIGYAVDEAAIVDTVGYGMYKATNQIAAPGDWAYNPDVAGYPYNPQKAKQLLAAAGYPNGFKTDIWYPSGTTDLDSAYQVVQRYLAEVGITATLQPTTRTKNTQMYVQGWDGMMNFGGQMEVGYPALRVYRINLVKGSQEFSSIIRPDDINDTFTKAASETDVAAQQKLVWDLQKMCIDKYSLITPLYAAYYCGASYLPVHDLKLYQPWNVRWRPEDAWLSK
jgi:peptide/nickel transport system substrate-binding protein